MEYIGRIENDRILGESIDPIIIFGAGKGIISLFRSLETLQVRHRVECICDNNIEKQGKSIDNVKVYGLEYVVNHYPNAIYIVYNRFSIEMSKQLIEKGIDRIHLYRR